MQVRSGTEALRGDAFGVWRVPGLSPEALCVQRFLLCSLHTWWDRRRREDAQGGCLVHLETVGGRGGDLQGWARASPILSDSPLLSLACLRLTFDSFLSGKWPCLVTLIWIS